MKAWRRHTMDCETRAKIHESLGEFDKAKQMRNLKLKNKHERKTQYAVEISEPSNLLYNIMYGDKWKEIITQIAEILRATQIANAMKKPQPVFLEMKAGQWTRPSPSLS